MWWVHYSKLQTHLLRLQTTFGTALLQDWTLGQNHEESETWVTANVFVDQMWPKSHSTPDIRLTEEQLWLNLGKQKLPESRASTGPEKKSIIESNNKCCVSKYVRKKKCREQNFVLSLYRKPTGWTSMWHLCTRENRIEKAKYYNSIQWSSLNWYKQLHHTTFNLPSFLYIFFLKFPLHFYVPLDE